MKMEDAGVLKGDKGRVCIIIQFIFVGNLGTLWSFEGFAVEVYSK